MLKMSGRIYNAMLKFAGASQYNSNFNKLFFCDGKVYATDSYAICRWTPAEECGTIEAQTGSEVDSFYFAPKMEKISSGTTIYIDKLSADIDSKSMVPTSNILDSVMEVSQKYPEDRILGINPDYLTAIANLGKAVRSDKCGSDGTVSIDWGQRKLHAFISAGHNGFFDVVVMPVIKKQ